MFKSVPLGSHQVVDYCPVGKENKDLAILSLQSISRDVVDNVSHPRRLDPTMELITYSFVLYLQNGATMSNTNHQWYGLAQLKIRIMQ